MVAVVECSECGDSLCGPCREAHSKTRVTKGHTVTEVAGPVIHHPRSDAKGLECKLTDFSPKLLLMFTFPYLASSRMSVPVSNPLATGRMLPRVVR